MTLLVRHAAFWSLHIGVAIGFVGLLHVLIHAVQSDAFGGMSLVLALILGAPATVIYPAVIFECISKGRYKDLDTIIKYTSYSRGPAVRNAVVTAGLLACVIASRSFGMSPWPEAYGFAGGVFLFWGLASYLSFMQEPPGADAQP